jgi:hypothetical protein
MNQYTVWGGGVSYVKDRRAPPWDDSWEPVEFMELTSGDVFRIYEQDGKPVIDQKGHKEWIASRNPYINK